MLRRTGAMRSPATEQAHDRPQRRRPAPSSGRRREPRAGRVQFQPTVNSPCHDRILACLARDSRSFVPVGASTILRACCRPSQTVPARRGGHGGDDWYAAMVRGCPCP